MPKPTSKPAESNSDARQLGEYRLRELRAENTLCWTWLAEQVSVSRMVLVDELRTDETEKSDTFLANCRAKASVEHPLISSVFEAVAEPGLCFYAHELLSGTTLAEFAKAGRKIDPGKLAAVLRRVADANLKHESLNRATSPLDLTAIHLEDHDIVRLKNLAVAGPRFPSQSLRDVAHLGRVLVPLLAQDAPGANRLLSVFSWMRGENLESPISWLQARNYCIEIERQLHDSSSAKPPEGKRLIGKKNYPIAWIFGGTAAAAIAILLAATLVRKKANVVRLPLPPPITVPGGQYLSPEGTSAAVPEFRISAHEVTIGEYASFLAVLAEKPSKGNYDHAEQPKQKTSHLPDDWSSLLKAAQTNGIWQGRPVTLDSPIVSIDWWDAMAYAEWKNARLPTQEEWFSAYHGGQDPPPTISPGGYLPVTAHKTDRTTSGMIGMAGSVSEWTWKSVQNPANPLGEGVWVIMGGSYFKAANGALSREWTPDRSMRRPDIGFRIAFDVK